MARLFPFRSEPSTGEGQPRVVDLEGEDADAVFGALSSTTARQIYARLDDEPGTPSDVADAIDSSIQNVRYHLEKLENAGLVEVVDTWYSSRGNEMSVYATTDGPLIVTSDESTASQLRTAISRLIGGIGALAGGSLLVQHGLTRWLAPSGAGAEGGAPLSGEDDAAGNGAADDDPGDDGADEPTADEASEEPSGEPEGADDSADDFRIADNDAEADDAEDSTAAEESADDGTTADGDAEAEGAAPNGDEYDAADGGEPAADGSPDGVETISDGGAEAAEAVFATVPPGLLFFLGGLVVLLAVTAYWYWYRPAY